MPGCRAGKAGGNLQHSIRIGRPARAAVLTIMAWAIACQPARPAAAGADAVTKTAAGARGVAALGRIEPYGGVVRVAAASTPDAMSGAILSKLLVDRGSDVTAGQLLAEVDTAALARSRVVEARAELETAKRDATASTSLADEACVLADVAAKRSKRKQDLLGRGLASSEDAEQAKGDADAGVASCRARRASASVAQSRISAAAARVTRIEAELERSFVRAPFAGRVIDVRRRPGEIVGMEGILELARVDQMHAVAEVFEADVRSVRAGQRALVRSPALPQGLTGTVTRIRPKVQKIDQIGDDPVARKDARIVEVEIKLDDGRAAANLTNLQVEVEIGR
jgi:HlyD family secretion protein